MGGGIDFHIGIWTHFTQASAAMHKMAPMVGMLAPFSSFQRQPIRAMTAKAAPSRASGMPTIPAIGIKPKMGAAIPMAIENEPRIRAGGLYRSGESDIQVATSSTPPSRHLFQNWSPVTVKGNGSRCSKLARLSHHTRTIQKAPNRISEKVWKLF